ncbi:MAG: hypothetical protein NDI61_06145 [Bdellovibrionaceae bacterium]|nr:hypothetical protein [Pseudobdellovibrionaceae bacterium]
MKRFVFAIVILMGHWANAFPSIINHGYTTCVTCHYSPSGGGALTSYGKFIAGEVFGGFQTSENDLPWLTPPEEDRLFVAQVMARGSQTRYNDPDITRSKFQRMQLDLETGIDYKKYFAFITSGMRGSALKSGQDETDFRVRTWYVGKRDLHYAIRAGRFYPEFGIRHPNHNIPTRKGLYWNQGDEPNIVQASYYTTNLDFNIGYMRGARETQLVDKEGVVGTFAYRTAQTKTGVSRLDVENENGTSMATSYFTHVGFLEKGYALAEYAIKEDHPDGSTWQRKNLGFFEAGWELYRGIIPYVGYQLTDNVTAETKTESYPLGLRLYPMTHVEIMMEYAPIQMRQSTGVKWADAEFVMFNVFF